MFGLVAFGGGAAYLSGFWLQYLADLFAGTPWAVYHRYVVEAFLPEEEIARKKICFVNAAVRTAGLPHSGLVYQKSLFVLARETEAASIKRLVDRGRRSVLAGGIGNGTRELRCLRNSAILPAASGKRWGFMV